jgi:hypothetical protein
MESVKIKGKRNGQGDVVTLKEVPLKEWLGRAMERKLLYLLGKDGATELTVDHPNNREQEPVVRKRRAVPVDDRPTTHR